MPATDATEPSIRDLYRCLQDLNDDKRHCQNRMEKLNKDNESFKTWTKMVENYNEKIKDVEQRIRALVDSSAVALLSELPYMKLFKNVKEVAAFAGLTPFVRQSGSSLKCNGSLCKAR